MKTLILAGGLGSRLGEETSVRPKPMVEIGGYPILWHIMHIYSHYGFNDFVVLTGYKHEVIKDYFVNYYTRNTDVTVDLSKNNLTFHNNKSEPWKVTILYTGKDSLTGARIKKAQSFLEETSTNEPFLLTYGDGVSDVNINEVVKFHKDSGLLCTLTAYQPEGRFGALDIRNEGRIQSFNEKPKEGGSWINAGFFVCEPEVFDYIPNGELVSFEQEPLRNLAKANQLNAYRHTGFWKPMDMLKDKLDLNRMWDENKAPWKVW